MIWIALSVKAGSFQGAKWLDETVSVFRCESSYFFSPLYIWKIYGCVWEGIGLEEVDWYCSRFDWYEEKN